jgi:Mg/Co/Ni transporter MgtE
LRRLRLNISYQKLEAIHPADLADIVEDLAPAEREAIFETIDSEVAAETLSEVDPKMQASILEALEPEKAADIVEEMAPDEAADALSELEEEASEDILDEMDSEPKTDVRELLEFEEDTAGGMMNTEYVVLHDKASVADALDALKGNEELLETLNVIFLIDEAERLAAAVPLARLFLVPGDSPLKDLAADSLLQVTVDERQDRVLEFFDKYNLLTLPVVDDSARLVGVITADDVISVLRNQ